MPLNESPDRVSAVGDEPPARSGTARWLVPLLAVVALVAGLAAGLLLRWDDLPPATPPETREDAVIRGPFTLGGDFELRNHDGGVTRLSDLRGHAVLLFFGYTHCPDICPTALADMRLVVNRLGENAGQVKVLFISVDPDRDTPEKLRSYVTHFNPGFIGLTGDGEALAAVTRQYGAVYEIVASEDGSIYEVGHSAFTYLVGGEGELRAIFPYGTSWETIAAEVEEVL